MKMTTKSLGFVELLHSAPKPTQKMADKLWDIICKNSDGVDVESIRSDFGLYTKSKERKDIIDRLRYLSKSKLGTFNWDKKQFQIEYIFGLARAESTIMRAGANNHSIMEQLPSYIESDDLVKNYMDKGTIKSFIEKTAKDVMLHMVENAVNKTIGSFSKAMQYMKVDEVKNYKHAIQCIADDFETRFKELNNKHPINKTIEYLFPEFAEVIIYNREDWTSGIVDGIYKTEGDGYKPVDYKFGQPKEKYYEPGIALELTFYKHLIMASNAEYCFNFGDPTEKWKPLYCRYGEMWYILDRINGVRKITFSDKWDQKYYTAVHNYWTALDTMSYYFQPEYGWRKDRFLDFCSKCFWRDKVCGWSDSWKHYNTIASEFDTENWDDVV